MSALVVAVLLDVEKRLASPPAWLQGRRAGYRDRDGNVFFQPGPGRPQRFNCFCLSEAITLGVTNVAARGTVNAWTELRSDVERELLTTLDAGDRWPCIAHFNDSSSTSFQDVVDLLKRTLSRLEST
jgi:hypothetical protein